MKTPARELREAVNICRGSRLYPCLSRFEKKEAITYCYELILTGIVNSALKLGAMTVAKA